MKITNPYLLKIRNYFKVGLVYSLFYIIRYLILFSLVLLFYSSTSYLIDVINYYFNLNISVFEVLVLMGLFYITDQLNDVKLGGKRW